MYFCPAWLDTEEKEWITSTKNTILTGMPHLKIEKTILNQANWIEGTIEMDHLSTVTSVVGADSKLPSNN